MKGENHKTNKNKRKTKHENQICCLRFLYSPPLYTLAVPLHSHQEITDIPCRARQGYILNSTCQWPCCTEYLKQETQTVNMHSNLKYKHHTSLHLHQWIIFSLHNTTQAYSYNHTTSTTQTLGSDENIYSFKLNLLF